MLRKHTLFILLILSAVSLAPPRSAAETPVTVETVEVTGSRITDDIVDVPAAAYVITKEEIALSGARSTQELLTRIPGVAGLYNGTSLAQSKGITVRGLNTEVLLLIDGVPTMNAVYGVGVALGSPFDLRMIPLDSIERIEAVRGASSAIYGSNAAGGVINVITKKGGPQNGGSAMLEGGNADWFRGSVRSTVLLSGDVRITAGYTRTLEGEMKIRLLSNGKYDRARNFMGNNFLFRVDKGVWSFSAELGDYNSKWDYSSDFSGAPITKEEDRQKNDYARLLFNYNDGTNSWRIYYQLDERKIYDGSGFTALDNKTLGVSFNHRQDIFGLPAVLGLDWRMEQAEYKNSGNPWGNSAPFDMTRKGFSPYMEFTIPLGEVGFDVGLRYEHWNVDGGAAVDEFIPRMSLNWEDAAGGLWYLTVGRYFSMPSFYQMFYRNSGWNPNPDLKPEKGWSYDLGFKNLKAKNPWSVNVFYMTMDDRISHELDPATYSGRYINVDEYRALGAEAEITFKLGKNWAYTQGLAWLKADEKDAGAEWKRSSMPRWDISGRLNYVSGPWSGELSINWLLDREIKNNSNGYDDKDILIFDFAVAWQSGRDKIRVACMNLFDKEYVLDSSGYITPERRFVLSYERMF